MAHGSRIKRSLSLVTLERMKNGTRLSNKVKHEILSISENSGRFFIDPRLISQECQVKNWKNRDSNTPPRSATTITIIGAV